jgi:CrcB protein
MPRIHWPTLAVISAGGVLGALARYAIIQAFPEPGTAFIWPVFWINVTGSLLIGAIIALPMKQPLMRPFLTTGVLGGYTTFSTYITGMQHELTAGAPRTALLYGAATLFMALAAAWTGTQAATLALARVRSAADTGDGQ